MTERHATVLVELVDAVEPELRENVVARAVELAESDPVGAFRRRLRKMIDSVRYATLAERHEEAMQRRQVLVEPAEDGMAWFMAFLPTVEAYAAHGRVTAMGKAIKAQVDESRTLDQIRADVLGDLLIDGRVDYHPGEVRGIRATVAVTVPVLALLDGGETEPGSAADLGADPA
jgi:hypothetical protein